MQPDLVVAPANAFTETELPEAPLLAVEVLSPSTRGLDLLLKKDRFEISAPFALTVSPTDLLR